MIVINCEQRSEAWYAARCGRVTGTRFKALIAGESTATYKDLVSNIACEIITGMSEEGGYVSADMERGIELEPVARREYAVIFETEVKEVGFIIPDEENKYHEWVGISPDGILENGMIEIKCPKYKTHLEYIEENKLPAEYKAQVQGQLFVTGFPFCDFMSHAEGMKPFIIRVYPDVEMFKLFEKRLDKLVVDVKSKLERYKNYDYLSE